MTRTAIEHCRHGNLQHFAGLESSVRYPACTGAPSRLSAFAAAYRTADHETNGPRIQKVTSRGVSHSNGVLRSNHAHYCGLLLGTWPRLFSPNSSPYFEFAFELPDLTCHIQRRDKPRTHRPVRFRCGGLDLVAFALGGLWRNLPRSQTRLSRASSKRKRRRSPGYGPRLDPLSLFLPRRTLHTVNRSRKCEMPRSASGEITLSPPEP